MDSSIDSSENVFCESSENNIDNSDENNSEKNSENDSGNEDDTIIGRENIAHDLVNITEEKTQENVKKVNNYFDFDTKKLVGVAMFAAFAYAVTFVFRLPVSFLTFDAKDSVITLASLIFGPVSGVAISLIVASIEFVSIGSHGLYGFIMDFASSAVFSFVAGLVYKIKRNATGAVLSFYSASLVMVSVMVVLNIIITPYFMGAPRDAVLQLIPTLILPFNIAKGFLNSAIAMFLYKPVSFALKKAKLVRGEVKISVNSSSLLIYISAFVTLVTAIVIFILLK